MAPLYGCDAHQQSPLAHGGPAIKEGSPPVMEADQRGHGAEFLAVGLAFAASLERSPYACLRALTKPTKSHTSSPTDGTRHTAHEGADANRHARKHRCEAVL